MKTIQRHSTLLLMLLILQACSLRSVEPPEISVVNLNLENANLLQTTATVDVRIDNENPYPLEVDGGVYRLYLNDSYLGKGLDKDGFRVERLSSVTKTIRINISNLSLLANINSITQSSKISYRVESKLHAEGRMTPMQIVDEGSFDFQGFQQGPNGSFRQFGKKQ